MRPANSMSLLDCTSVEVVSLVKAGVLLICLANSGLIIADIEEVRRLCAVSHFGPPETATKCLPSISSNIKLML